MLTLYSYKLVIANMFGNYFSSVFLDPLDFDVNSQGNKYSSEINFSSLLLKFFIDLSYDTIVS